MSVMPQVPLERLPTRLTPSMFPGPYTQTISRHRHVFIMAMRDDIKVRHQLSSPLPECRLGDDGLTRREYLTLAARTTVATCFTVRRPPRSTVATPSYGMAP